LPVNDLSLIILSDRRYAMSGPQVCYNNFWRSDEGVRLQCVFDIAAGVSAEDIKDIVFSKFYDIAITTK